MYLRRFSRHVLKRVNFILPYFFKEEKYIRTKILQIVNLAKIFVFLLIIRNYNISHFRSISFLITASHGGSFSLFYLGSLQLLGLKTFYVKYCTALPQFWTRFHIFIKKCVLINIREIFKSTLSNV